MKKLKVSDIKKGDRFSKPVYLDKETVLVSSQSQITENLVYLKFFVMVKKLIHSKTKQARYG